MPFKACQVAICLLELIPPKKIMPGSQNLRLLSLICLVRTKFCHSGLPGILPHRLFIYSWTPPNSLEKKIENCGHCDDYACEKLEKLLQHMPPENKKRLDASIPVMKHDNK